MPAYHSKYCGLETGEEACGCALLPLKVTKSRGPAPIVTDAAEEDIVDEVIKFFRPNSLFRNFDVKGGPDRTLIYLTLSMQQCLMEVEKTEKKADASRALLALTLKAFPIPGGPGWALGGLFPTPQDINEGETWRLYMKQAREELSYRVLEVLYSPDGSKNKWWGSFSKRKFMGKELK
ncbi:actin-related protein 2/3 complex subunit 3 [Pelagophyceae sp. CCMP2097]|nr:actin-related protein 2/3 complex subunit 3 [Pelagophyceae sp. CCMP2097]